MLLHLTHIIFEIGLAVVLAVMAGYATHATIDLTKGDKEVDTANTLLTTSSAVGWVTVVATIISFVVMIVFPEEIMASKWLRRGVSGMMYVVLGATLIVGILMAYSASLIKKSTEYSHNKDEYKFCKQGAIIGLSFSGTLLVAYLSIQIYDYYKHGSTSSPGAKKGSSALSNFSSSLGMSNIDMLSSGLQMVDML